METAKMELNEVTSKLMNLQTKFNNDTNGTCWTDKVTDKGRVIDFPLAMSQEISEGLDSLNWKWWKSLDAVDDMENLKMEMVDVLFFLTSEIIINKTLELLNTVVVHTYEDRDSTREQIIDALLVLNNRVVTYREQGDIVNFVSVVQQFISVIEHIPAFNFDAMYKLYIGKNALNMFRQMNGYKEGTYVKVWNGKEDNVYLMNYLRKMDVSDISIDDTLDYLTIAYEDNVS